MHLSLNQPIHFASVLLFTTTRHLSIYDFINQWIFIDITENRIVKSLPQTELLAKYGTTFYYH
jgi:hypothetical protein